MKQETFDQHHQRQREETNIHPRRRGCSASLFLTLLGVVMALLLWSATPGSRSVVQEGAHQAGRGGALLPPICGHPAQVVSQLGLSSATIPDAQVLSRLPRPTSDPPPDLAATAATYNPASDQLCIGSALALASMGTGATLTASPTAAAQSGTTSPLPTTLTTPPTSWVQSTLSALARTYEHGLSDVLGTILNWAISFGFMVVTPPDLTYQHHVVRALNAWLVGLMDGVVMLILVIAGYQAMLLHRPGDLQELIPRLVLATIIGNFSLFFLQQFIDLLNLLCTEAELLFGLAGIHVFTLPAGIDWTTTGEYLILTYLLDLVILVLLSLQMAARIALLDVFCILFALLPLLYVLRITRSWATFAMQAFVATLVIQFLQVLCAGMGAALISSLLAGTSGTPVTLLIGAATLVLTFKLPDLLLPNVLRAVRQSGESLGEIARTVGETVAQVVSIRQI